MIKSICIVRLSALGDVLMLVPLVRTLQATYPLAKITWIISRPAYDLVEGMEDVEFIVINKPNGLSDYWQFRQAMRKRRFDVLLATQASFRANLLYPLIRAKRKIGFDTLRAKDGHGLFVHERILPGDDHTLESFLKFAEPLNIIHKKIVWDLPLPLEAQQWAENVLPAHSPLFILNPAASKPERSWDVTNYVEVLHHVQSTWKARIILTGGPGEYDRTLGKEISKHIQVTNLIGKTKPKQLLAVIKKADLVLCPDTGPSHMAAAVNTPVIALHAVTSSLVSGPYTFRHLAVDFYPQAVKQFLGKSDTTNVWGTHVHGENTMKLIPVNEVIKKIDLVFRTRSS
jgi:heptosyltransferase I